MTHRYDHNGEPRCDTHLQPMSTTMTHGLPCHNGNINDDDSNTHLWPLLPWHIDDGEPNQLASSYRLVALVNALITSSSPSAASLSILRPPLTFQRYRPSHSRSLLWRHSSPSPCPHSSGSLPSGNPLDASHSSCDVLMSHMVNLICQVRLLHLTLSLRR